MYHWTQENEIVEKLPNLKAVKKIVNAKNDKPTFTMQQIQELLQNASTQIQAMIWLGLNCGIGRTDYPQLKWTPPSQVTAQIGVKPPCGG